MQKITPHLWFNKEAKEAAEFYCSFFPDSKMTHVNTLHDTPSGTVDIVSFQLSGQSFMAISAGPLFKFNEAISFIVHCDTQEEMTTTGTSSALAATRTRNNAAGSKTNSASPGRSFRPR